MLNSCANIVQPTGGHKDEAPPKIIYSYPRNNETQFKGKQVILKFDEDITLNNLNQELILSPNLNLKYKFEQSKKELKINFIDALPENTTINLQFRQAIKDFNEGNILQDPSIAFSTGNELDSIKLRGTITNLFNNKPVENVLVGLFATTDTFSLNNSKPDYFTKSKKDGTYRLNYIRPDTFFLVAFNDVNGNLQYNNKEERLAFSTNSIILTNDTVIDLSMSYYDDEKPEIVSKNTKWKVSNILFNEGLDTIKISYPNDPILIPTFRYDSKETLISIYQNNIKKDSLMCRFLCTDTSGNILDSTFYIKFGQNQKDTLNNWSSIKFDVIPTKSIQISKQKEIVITAAHPISQIIGERIKFLIDSMKLLTADSINIKIENGKAVLKTNKLAFDSILNMNIDSQAIKLVNDKFLRIGNISYAPFKQVINENASSISGTLKNEWGRVIVELINENATKVKELIAIETFSFPDIEPGNYQLRVIIDTNRNLKWDGANFKKKAQPEKIVFWKEPILIKQGWDVQDIHF